MFRPVRILSIAFRGNPVDDVIQMVYDYEKEVDIILFPELWQGENSSVEKENSEFLKKIASLAAAKHSYVLCPVYMSVEECKCNNSAVLFDRNGIIVGRYDKLFPVISEMNDLRHPVVPGKEATVIDTDFGKVGIAICFDANFSEVWESLRDKGAELVLFVSDYSARLALKSWSCLYHYYIVSATRNNDCTIVDISGEELYYNKCKDGEVGINYYVLDLDRCIFHRNFNIEQRDKLLVDNPDIVMEKDIDTDHWFVLSSNSDRKSAKMTASKYGLEPVNEYIERSRNAANPMLRARIYKK